MNSYNEHDDDFLNEPTDSDDGQNTMAVLNTLGGGEDAMRPFASLASLVQWTLAVGCGALTL